MIRFVWRGLLWVYLAWFGGLVLGSVILGNERDIIAYGAQTAVGVLALVADHRAVARRRRACGDDS